MKKLYLVTMGFPYGKGEKTFITPELGVIANCFDVTIISVTSRDIMSDIKNRSKLPENVRHSVIFSDIKFFAKVRYALQSFFCISLYRDWGEVLLSSNQIFSRLLNSLKYHSLAIYYRNQMDSIFRDDVSINDDFIVYTFWCLEPTLGGCFLKHKYSNMKLITRLLGRDLYHERRDDGRQCFRSYINKYIDAFFFASESMLTYYKKHFFKNLSPKVCHIGRIGTKRQNNLNQFTKSEIFTLYSCSNVIPLKRVELIVQALGCINEKYRMHWVHFGDGSEFDNISKMAEKVQRSNKSIKIELKGHTTREKIFKFLCENPIDCFITTTSTEGGEPLALVEALSFGIPVIATNVADISRTVQGNGVLLPANPSVMDVKSAIEAVIEMGECEKRRMREISVEIWSQYFNEEALISRFVRDLNDL